MVDAKALGVIAAYQKAYKFQRFYKKSNFAGNGKSRKSVLHARMSASYVPRKPYENFNLPDQTNTPLFSNHFHPH